MNSCKIKGFGYALAKRKVSNEELSTFVDTSDEWITTRTGIKSRYISEKENTSDLGTRAAIQALQDAQIQSKEIDLILVATFTPDQTTPSTACLIQEKLHMNEQRVMAFDLNAACSGFLYALECAHALIQAGFVHKALVIGAETISKQLDWKDRNTCIIFGDGAGAVVLTKEESPCRMYHYANAQGDDAGIIHCDAPRPRVLFKDQSDSSFYVHMEGSATFRFAVKAMQESIEEVMKQANVAIEDIDYFIPHQANKRIIDHVAKRLNIKRDQLFINIDEVGNTSAASIPLALGQMKEKGLLKEGMKLVLSGFGAGFTWASTYIEL